MIENAVFFLKKTVDRSHRQMLRNAALGSLSRAAPAKAPGTSRMINTRFAWNALVNVEVPVDFQGTSGYLAALG